MKPADTRTEVTQPSRTTLERIAALRSQLTSARAAREAEERVVDARIDALTAQLARDAMQPRSMLLPLATMVIAAAAMIGVLSSGGLPRTAPEQASIIPEPPADFAQELAAPATDAAHIAEAAEIALVEAEIPIVTTEAVEPPAKLGASVASPTTTTRKRMAAPSKSTKPSASSSKSAVRAANTSHSVDPLAGLDDCDANDPLCGL